MREMRTRVFIILLCVLFLCGCDKDDNKSTEKTEESEYFIYYTNDEHTRIFKQVYSVASSDTMDVINELINELRKGNFYRAHLATLPQGIVSSNINGDILILDFDEHYEELKGVEEVLRRAAIVKTMCQVPGITYVQFSINGLPLTINGNAVGNMSDTSFVNNIGDSSDYEVKNQITVYYANAYGNKLRKLPVTIKIDGTKSLEQLAVEAVLGDPDKIGYYSVFDENVEINRMVVEEKKCYIDFNEEFLDRKNGVSEEVAVYSIVNTLTDLTTVNQVMITINGEIHEFYEDDVDMTGFFERNYEINEERE